MLDAIDGAESYILLQSYIFRSDGIGNEIVTHLIDACSRGCRIALLYDEVGSWKLQQKLLDELADAGGSYSGFTISRRLLSRLRINFRNHRKVLVVDGKRAFVGGLNIGQEYVDGGAQFSEWRDTHLEVSGPAVQALQLCFCEDWLFATAEEKDRTSVCDDLNWNTTSDHPDGTEGIDGTVKICPTGPHDVFKSGDLLFQQLVCRAERRLWIASPYFIPDERVINQIKLAGLRGVEVKVLIPERSDHRIVDYAHQAVISDLLPYRIAFYRFQPGFSHQKVILVDDQLSSVGSANSDNRSFRLNFEVSCLIWGPSFASTVEQMLEEDFSRCRRATHAEDVPSTRAALLKANAARMFAPAL